MYIKQSRPEMVTKQPNVNIKTTQGKMFVQCIHTLYESKYMYRNQPGQFHHTINCAINEKIVKNHSDCPYSSTLDFCLWVIEINYHVINHKGN